MDPLIAEIFKSQFRWNKILLVNRKNISDIIRYQVKPKLILVVSPLFPKKGHSSVLVIDSKEQRNVARPQVKRIIQFRAKKSIVQIKMYILIKPSSRYFLPSAQWSITILFRDLCQAFCPEINWITPFIISYGQDGARLEQFLSANAQNSLNSPVTVPISLSRQSAGLIK